MKAILILLVWLALAAETQSPMPCPVLLAALARPDHGFGVQNSGAAHALDRRGNVVRFEVQPGDHWPHDIVQDKGHTLRERSELSGLSYEPGAAMTAHWTITIEPGPATINRWTVFAQVHQLDFDGQHTYTVPLAIGLAPGDRLYVRGTSNPNNSYKSFHDVVNWQSATPLARGVPHHFQVMVRMDQLTAAGGYLRVIADGVTIVDYTGPIGAQGTLGYYWKYGIYRDQSKNSFATVISDASFGGSACGR